MEQFVINKEILDEDGDTIYNHRNYIISEENNSYTLRIDSCGKNLIFNISLKNNLEYNYKIKMSLSTIVDKLELNPQAYNKIELIIKIFDFINENKKFSINLIDDRSCILIIKFINVLEEKTYEIKLDKNYLSEKEKYTDIINRFKLLNKYNSVNEEKMIKMNNIIAELNDKIKQKDKEIIDEIKKKDNIINEMNQKIKEQESKNNELKKLIIELIQKNSVELEKSFNSKIDNLTKTMDEKAKKTDNYINNTINKNNINIQNEISKLKETIKIHGQKMDNQINDINNKFNRQKNINDKINNIILYENEEHKKKINYEFQKVPNKLQFKKDITTKNVTEGWNDLFEIFISYKDNKEYLISANAVTNELDIYDLTLDNNESILSLKGHNCNVKSVRYFLNNKNNKEYLVSIDINKIVIVWDISNNYNIIYNFNTFYENNIISCLLIFPKNSLKNYMVTSTYSISSNQNVNSFTRVYSLNDGTFIRNIKDTNKEQIYYLLPWFKKKNNKYYIVQFAENKIIIDNLIEDEKYIEFVNQEGSSHYSGFIKYGKNTNYINYTDYLYSSSTKGHIYIWDLYNKSLIDIINVNQNQQLIANIIQWKQNYYIAANYYNCSFKIVIIKFDKKVEIIEIKTKHSGQLACIKKINLPKYGESLLTAAKDGTIKLWSIDEKPISI